MKRMKRISLIAAALAASLSFATAHAADRGTPQEAEQMVKAAVGHIKQVGQDKAYADFTSKKAPFKDRDLYVVVYGLDGKVHAHGQNAKMVGKEMIDLKDPDGKPFVRERVDLARSKGNFWQDYKFTDPLTKTVKQKSMYCEKVDQTVVCTGVYKAS